jgi:hypothetical protein
MTNQLARTSITKRLLTKRPWLNRCSITNVSSLFYDGIFNTDAYKSSFQEIPQKDEKQASFEEINLLKQHLRQKYKNYSDTEIEEIIQKFIGEYLLKINLQDK